MLYWQNYLIIEDKRWNNLIINADDFGYSKSVNMAINECFKLNVINRTTIMVNMPCAEEAASLAKENGYFDRVGLHINLTEGKALSKECAESELCDENGFFKGEFHKPFKSRLYLKKEIRYAIFCEVRAQIEKYIQMGFTLMHADSHNYTHAYFSVYIQVQKLMKEYGFKSIRISRNISAEKFSIPFKIYKNIFNGIIKNLKINGKKIQTTRYFCSVQDFVKTSNNDKVKNDIEFMTHPDYVDGVIMDNTLPHPHPFVSKEWINDNGLYLDTAEN